jgi:hypothetical protein
MNQYNETVDKTNLNNQLCINNTVTHDMNHQFEDPSQSKI